MKSTYLSKKAFELEEKMIPANKWLTAHPEAYKVALDASNEGIPTGIAYDEELGWCVLISGQGPFIVWAENDIDDVKNIQLIAGPNDQYHIEGCDFCCHGNCRSI